MACILNISSCPLVCTTNGTFWRISLQLLGFTGAPCGQAVYQISSGSYSATISTGAGLVGNFFIPAGSPLGTYNVSGSVTCATIPCTVTNTTVVSHNYNIDPLTIRIISITDEGCGGTSLGSVTFTGQGDPLIGFFFEIWTLAGVFVQASNGGNVWFNNTYTFTGLPAGEYCIRNYRVYPPGSCGNSPSSKAICFEVYCITIAQSCILKAVDCGDPTTFIVFDGTSLPVSIIGSVIKAVFTGFTQRCWNIIQTTDPVTGILVSWLGPYNDCDTCSFTPCSDILSTITKTDEQCNQANGTASVTPLNGTPPYIYQWSNGGNTQSISGLTAGPYSVTVIDSGDCSGTNSVIIANIPCSSYYLITPCDTDQRAFVVKDPTTSPDPNPNTYVGNVFEGTVTLSNGNILTGCFSLIPTAQVSNATATINVTFYSHADCSGCLPPTWQITRCDDNNIFYLTNTDLSAVEDQVINNVIMSGCDSTTLPCGSLPDQCWIVSAAARFEYPVIIESYGTVYPDCDCCKPC